tara:strand:- start:863 stop:1213 length:351 start_codon:yes stop_codon:yes gene_type:complete
MPKKQINYSDLSSKELELLKDTFIDKKVKSMNNDDLKNFAYDNISLQIKNTIGNEEESEAWKEMEMFFKDDFENIIREIQVKLGSKKNEEFNLNPEKIKFETEFTVEDKKLDMWED